MVGTKERMTSIAAARMEKARIYREAEIPMISLSQVPLEDVAKGEKEDAEVVWHAAKWSGAGERRQVRLNGRVVGALARHLKAVEWARVMGRGARQDSRVQTLEQEASLWQRRQR